MAWVLTAAVVTTVASTYISIEGQKAASKQAESVQKYNAALQAADADRIDREGVESIRRSRVRNKRILASQEAKYAGAGIVTATGTPLTVMAETAKVLELEALDRKYQSDSSAASKRAQSGFSTAQAKNIDRALPLNVIGTTVTGATQTAKLYI